jgi:hypothetical protein
MKKEEAHRYVTIVSLEHIFTVSSPGSVDIYKQSDPVSSSSLSMTLFGVGTFPLATGCTGCVGDVCVAVLVLVTGALVGLFGAGVG